MLLGDADVERAVGERFENASSPTGIIIAAVMATMSSRSSPNPTRASLNSSVQLRPEISSGSPVSGLMTPTAWNWSLSSLSAGS